jgi:parallel beta-helix repeat protein
MEQNIWRTIFGFWLIGLRYSSNNILTNNTATNVFGGIYLCSSSNDNVLINNTANLNRIFGIALFSSFNNTLTNNIMSDNGFNFSVTGKELSHFTHNIDTSNKINGKPIYYWVNERDKQVPSDAGYVGIVNSKNITVKDLTLTNNGQGVLFVYTENSKIENVEASNNMDGIYLYESSNNKIYLNDVNNTDNVYSLNSTNIWNSTSKITYTYNGSIYTNYTGNYWSDYTGNDTDGDGIGDTPYSIDSDKDNYPLMEPFGNYFKPTGNIFDTGEPVNPYPSIFGTHNGTIKPNVTIEVSKLYTYPCVGTGGHTKYARIWNNSGLNVNASWNGYLGDWHNISFNKTFTLAANKTYNYTLRTGSYPQIIHESGKEVTGGIINCTQFTDANGKIYNDWIPAIRLFR